MIGNVSSGESVRIKSKLRGDAEVFESWNFPGLFSDFFYVSRTRLENNRAMDLQIGSTRRPLISLFFAVSASPAVTDILEREYSTLQGQDIRVLMINADT